MNKKWLFFKIIFYLKKATKGFFGRHYCDLQVKIIKLELGKTVLIHFSIRMHVTVCCETSSCTWIRMRIRIQKAKNPRIITPKVSIFFYRFGMKSPRRIHSFESAALKICSDPDPAHLTPFSLFFLFLFSQSDVLT